MKKSKYLKITSEQIYNKRRKFIKSIGLGVGSLFFYSWGLLTVNKRIFPYNFIKSIKEKFIPTPPLHEHKRFLNIENQKLINLSSINLKNLGVFVTYGQSNSSNHGQIGYIPKNKVYMFNDNKIFKYKDPSIGASGIDGSVWGMTGDKIINSGLYGEVSFTNTGWGGKTISQLSKGKLFDYFIEQYLLTLKMYGKVDAILFHQGEDDAEYHQEDQYYNNFMIFMKKIRKLLPNPRLFLSIVSHSGDPGRHRIYVENKKLRSQQFRLINDNIDILRGPDTDILVKREDRLPNWDFTHFSLLGFDKFSDQWIDSLKKSKVGS